LSIDFFNKQLLEFNIMVSVVNDACVKCKSCAEVCPVDAFREAENMLVIDPDVCIDCGVCISECPQEAITPEDEADEKWVKYTQDNAKNLPNANE
jgi:ferredoxin